MTTMTARGRTFRRCAGAALAILAVAAAYVVLPMGSSSAQEQSLLSGRVTSPGQQVLAGGLYTKVPNIGDETPCQYCDSPGGIRTLGNQVCMPLNGRVQAIDFCIHKIVAALNAGGIRTVASCCGHGTMKGNIILEDGRVLLILQKPESLEAWKDVIAL